MEQDKIKVFIDKQKDEHEENVFFSKYNLGAEVHWFFTQGIAALKHELYLPACLSFIIGIEASLRITQAHITKPVIVDDLGSIKTLSNRLLNDAKNNGMPVNLLAFPNENDFSMKLASQKPNNVNVEIVRVRHNLCHGNVLEYRNTDLGKDNIFFTPECLREIADNLYYISKVWAVGLSKYRKNTLNL